eukprot:Transcript_2029.p1 GENE.Transcript_2029~~Transcript_2029.p1  ORF type:complete len:119 (+),score=33.84 Transcript_2029:77-433(+)
MAGLGSRIISFLAQKYIVKALSESPAFQQFALRTASWAQRIMEPAKSQAARAQPGSARSAHTQRQQQQQQQQAQQKQQTQAQGADGPSFEVMRRRAAAFGSALADELEKDLGLKKKER